MKLILTIETSNAGKTRKEFNDLFFGNQFKELQSFVWEEVQKLEAEKSFGERPPIILYDEID